MRVPSVIASPALRLGSAAQNALEVARFGGLETGEEPTAFDVVARQRVYRLRRYLHDPDERRGDGDGDGGGRPPRRPILLVPPLMLSAEVYDVSPHASAVATLHEHGADPWVVDFGAPEHEEGGLERTLTDHVLAVSDAVDRVREATGQDVHLSGYSQGGMFAYQAAAYRRAEGLASVITFGSPVDTRSSMPFGLPEEFALRTADVLTDLLPEGLTVPAWVSATGFRLLDPVSSIQQQISFLLQLHDREALLPRERQRRFLQGEGFVAYPGPAIAEFLKQFITHNRMLDGGFEIEGRLVTLADISCPILYFVGEVDTIASTASVRGIVPAAPRATVHEVSLRAGHFGLVVGSASQRTTWPVIGDWMAWAAGDGELPEAVQPPGELDVAPPSAGLLQRGVYGAELAAGFSVGALSTVTRTARGAARSAVEIGADAVRQAPRLARLERVRPGTQVSLGRLLDEQASRAPDGTLFLFEDRAHTHAAAKHRIDSVVRGLISAGVHQGEHVGVLMATRPSALTVVAALNRLGAVTVLLRPDGDLAREIDLGRVRRVVVDPDNVDDVADHGLPVLVLGGGAEPRELAPQVTDLERVDPDEVRLPAWYRPNAGRARDLAYVLFSGDGDATRANHITNRRWALSAFGTASSASLGPSDTVYCVTPIHHLSALLTSVGGAVAGGARIALARQFDPATFWDEVRRYGVTVVSYTWTMLREIVDAPPDPAERHHPVRLFVGSGMPRGLQERVTRRFAPAKVLEFYASTQGAAILADVAGRKPGSMGRRLPGTAQVQVVEWDVEQGRLRTGRDGYLQRAPRGRVGMLIARVSAHANEPGESPLRGVFAREDAWMVTGDLFRRDADGDLWLYDSARALVRTPEGTVAPAPIRDLLGSLDAVDLAVSYGVPREDGTEVACAAVSLRAGCELDVADVSDALAALDRSQRPSVVRVVDEIAVTTWYRPVSAPLRAEGVPKPSTAAGARPVWRLGDDGTYVRLTAAGRRGLLATGAGDDATDGAGARVGTARRRRELPATATG